MPQRLQLPRIHAGLSARVLLLTVAFVLFAEILIYVPSISRYRLVYLEQRIAAAHLATLTLEAAPGSEVPMDLEDELLRHAGVLSIILRRPQVDLMLGTLVPVDAIFDLRDQWPPTLIVDAFATLYHRGGRMIRVVGVSPQASRTLVDVILPEGPMWSQMVDYSWRILQLSILISLVTAGLVWVSLQLMLVLPLRRLTERVIAFRSRPEDASTDAPGTDRSDEIGVIQRELGSMQHALRAALAQRTRLAALGAAVGKINHDLRNVLASAMLVSDRLEQSRDPQVRTAAPRLVDALERAARMCSDTLNFARTHTHEPRRQRVPLRALVEEIGGIVLEPAPNGIVWRNEVGPEITVSADRDQLFRVLMNLGRNARQAIEQVGTPTNGDADPEAPGAGATARKPGGMITTSAWRSGEGHTIEVADTGPGVPESAREHLFEAFSSSTKPEGSGLGLAIAREIMRGHGGDIALVRTGSGGTVFRLTLPER